VKSGDRRIEELRSSERALIAVRWIAVVFAGVQVQTYGAMPYPAGMRELALGLVAGLAATNVAAMIAVRRPLGHRSTVVLATATLVADVAVVGGLVWVYAFDNGSAHYLMLFVLPAEAALKFRLAGAVTLWAVMTALYATREAWGVAEYGFAISIPSISYRMGILLIVSLIVGLFAKRLGQRTDELAGALDELEREEQWRSTLIDMLAHDVRSPVGAAMSAAQSIRDRAEELSPDEVRTLLGIAIRQNRRAMALADDLLAMARARHGRLELTRQLVEITPLLERVVGWLGSDDSWLTIDSPSDLHAFVDPARLEQIATNLLSNARKHGRPPVVIEARPWMEQGVQIRVSDTGEGVPESAQDILFTAFTSGPRTDSVGLGLWLVALLAEAHGGHASYTTVDGMPTFVVQLPGADSAAETASRPPVHSASR
jgi:signal transduction histidine kinase